MRVQRKKVWSLFLLSALLLVALYVFAGCTTTQPASDTTPQPPPAQQAAQSSPAEQTPQPTAPPVTPSPVPDKGKAEIVVPLLHNPDFEMDHFGWSHQEGTVGTEENGNKYMMAGYTWGLYQFLQVKPGETYQIYCKAKQGVGAASPARLCLIFYDSGHNIMPESQSFYYTPGAEWSSFPKNAFKVPENALFTKLFLLSNGKGTVCFDDIEITPAVRSTAK